MLTRFGNKERTKPNLIFQDGLVDYKETGGNHVFIFTTKTIYRVYNYLLADIYRNIELFLSLTETILIVKVSLQDDRDKSVVIP